MAEANTAFQIMKQKIRNTDYHKKIMIAEMAKLQSNSTVIDIEDYKKPISGSDKVKVTENTDSNYDKYFQQEPKSQAFNVKTIWNDLALRKEDVEKMTDCVFLIPNILVRGHLAAYVAPANGGKTTLFRYVSEELTGHNLDVFYINVDGNPSDLKRHYSHAEKFGYTVISPDARDGKNTIDVISTFKQLADSDADLSNQVYIIDTLKKFVDMLHKAQLKETLQMFRKLSVKGATIALLCHSNKYKDANGKQVYEGTVDLRNDVDELIYLDYSKDEVNKTQDITTTPDKVRASFEPVSYRILFGEDRKVFKLDEVSIPVSTEHKELIDLISEAISNGDDNQKAIISYVSERMVIGINKIRDFLLYKSKGDQPLWTASKTGSNNALRYTLN